MARHDPLTSKLVFASTTGYPDHICGFCGCENSVAAPEYSWKMCDPCFNGAMEVEDSEFCDACNSFCAGCDGA